MQARTDHFGLIAGQRHSSVRFLALDDRVLVAAGTCDDSANTVGVWDLQYVLGCQREGYLLSDHSAYKVDSKVSCVEFWEEGVQVPNKCPVWVGTTTGEVKLLAHEPGDKYAMNDDDADTHDQLTLLQTASAESGSTRPLHSASVSAIAVNSNEALSAGQDGKIFHLTRFDHPHVSPPCFTDVLVTEPLLSQRPVWSNPRDSQTRNRGLDRGLRREIRCRRRELRRELLHRGGHRPGSFLHTRQCPTRLDHQRLCAVLGVCAYECVCQRRVGGCPWAVAQAPCAMIISDLILEHPRGFRRVCLGDSAPPPTQPSSSSFSAHVPMRARTHKHTRARTPTNFKGRRRWRTTTPLPPSCRLGSQPPSTGTDRRRTDRPKTPPPPR